MIRHPVAVAVIVVAWVAAVALLFYVLRITGGPPFAAVRGVMR